MASPSSLGGPWRSRARARWRPTSSWRGADAMQSRELILRNPSGLHARPAALFVEVASRFGARITVENLDRGSRTGRAQSVLLLLTAGVQRGHRIRIAADGPDEVEALRALEERIPAGRGGAAGGGRRRRGA